MKRLVLHSTTNYSTGDGSTPSCLLIVRDGCVQPTLRSNPSTERTRRFRERKPWAARSENFNFNTKRRLRIRRRESQYVEKVDVRAVYEQADGLCEKCGTPVVLDAVKGSPWKAHFDHRYPLCWGGRHEQRNVQLLHQVCHVGKSKLTKPVDCGIMTA